jgi:hypothetical protein
MMAMFILSPYLEMVLKRIFSVLRCKELSGSLEISGISVRSFQIFGLSFPRYVVSL